MRRICLKAFPSVLAAGLFVGLAASTGAAEMLYDFEAEVPEAWSEDSTHEVAGQSHVLGPFNQRNDDYPDKASLSIGKESQGKPLTVEFDLVLLGNWDSQGSRADSFTVEDGDGNELLKVEEFPCNLTDKDENLPEGTPGATKVGKRYMRHCVLHKSFVLPAGAEEVVFKGKTTGRRSEFWALDNVRLKAG